MMSGSLFACLAGFLAAAASLSAKLSLGADHVTDMCVSVLTRTRGGAEECAWLHVPLRLSCGVLLLACNTVMWTFFSKALRHSSSSATASVTTTASNFLFSAVLGRMMFGESHGVLWWAGLSLSLCGLLLLHGSSPHQTEKKNT